MAQVQRDDGVRISPELTNVAGVVGAALAVLAAGSAILSVLPSPDLWMTAAAYAAPASLGFVAYWWMSQRV